jgi:hypothetical protein
MEAGSNRVVQHGRMTTATSPHSAPPTASPGWLSAWHDVKLLRDHALALHRPLKPEWIKELAEVGQAVATHTTNEAHRAQHPGADLTSRIRTLLDALAIHCAPVSAADLRRQWRRLLFVTLAPWLLPLATGMVLLLTVALMRFGDEGHSLTEARQTDIAQQQRLIGELRAKRVAARRAQERTRAAAAQVAAAEVSASGVDKNNAASATWTLEARNTELEAAVLDVNLSLAELDGVMLKRRVALSSAQAWLALCAKNWRSWLVPGCSHSPADTAALLSQQLKERTDWATLRADLEALRQHYRTLSPSCTKRATPDALTKEKVEEIKRINATSNGLGWAAPSPEVMCIAALSASQRRTVEGELDALRLDLEIMAHERMVVASSQATGAVAVAARFVNGTLTPLLLGALGGMLYVLHRRYLRENAQTSEVILARHTVARVCAGAIVGTFSVQLTNLTNTGVLPVPPLLLPLFFCYGVGLVISAMERMLAAFGAGREPIATPPGAS